MHPPSDEPNDPGADAAEDEAARAESPSAAPAAATDPAPPTEEDAELAEQAGAVLPETVPDAYAQAVRPDLLPDDDRGKGPGTPIVTGGVDDERQE